MTDRVPVIQSFKQAPVIETVLSIQYAPLSAFSIGYFGIYWNLLRHEFPRIEVKPPIMHKVENFEPAVLKPSVTPFVEWPSEQHIRCWLLDERGTCFIQLQQDRFLYNWQKIASEDTYPRYERIRSKFLEEWQRFCSFLERERLGQPQVDQCEVTYVNHIEYGDGWSSFGQLNKVISLWSGQSSGQFLPEPEKLSINVQYLLPENKGRLYVSLQPVIRKRDGKEVLQLNLTARGAPASSRVEDVFSWLDLGREWVVQGFTDFTTAEIHTLWGREL